MIEPQLLLHCGPIFFLTSRAALPTEVFRSGTFGLIDTGEKKLLVTCAHVWSDFWEVKQANPEAQIAILLGTNRPVILPNDAPLHLNHALDLATYDMTPILSECHSREFFRINQKPARNVNKKDALALLGYLGEARQTSSCGANFRYEFIGASVTDVSGPFVVADLLKLKRFNDRDGEMIEPPQSFGGLSGSPVYFLEKTCALSLVGFVTSTALGVLRMTHARCLNPDGSFC